MLTHEMRRRLSELRGSQFSKNMGAGSLNALIGAVLSVGAYPVYLHFLGYHTYGIWLLLTMVISVAQMGSLGVPWALTKLVAEAHGRSDWEGVRQYINTACVFTAAMGSALFALTFAFRRQIINWSKLGRADEAIVYSLVSFVAALSVLVVVFSTLNAALAGLGRIDLMCWNETLAQVSIIAVAVALLNVGLGVRSMLVAFTCAYTLTLLVAYGLLARLSPIPLLRIEAIRRDRLRRLLGTGGWILAASTFSLLIVPFNRLMLSRYAGASAITVYDICYTGSMRIRGFLEVAFRAIMPEMSKLASAPVAAIQARASSLNRNAAHLILIFALPFYLVLFAAAPFLLRLWLRHSFTNTLPGVFRTMLLASFLSLWGVPAYFTLIGVGRGRKVVSFSLFQLTVNIAAVLAVLLCSGTVTAGSASWAFVLAAGCSTLYVRLSCARVERP
jgi:O-antigen/teichoic acid export membrane protein